MEPLVARMIDIRRRRDRHWDRLDNKAQYMMNRAVNTAHKDCTEAGLWWEAHEAIRAYESGELEVGALY